MTMRRIALQAPFVAAVFLLAANSTAAAKIIYVDDNASADFDTIQAAIEAAVDGDTVLVAPGTYTGDGNRDIDFKGKAITVRSEDGPETCIIDCQSFSYSDQQGLHQEFHRGFHFHRGEDLRSVLEGFTITGGWPPGHGHGGAILCDSAGPRIVNCVIHGNRARYGGGVAILDSAVHLERVILSNNVAADGGAIEYYNQGTDVSVFIGCILAGNHAELHIRFGGEGGGILLGGNASFINCLIVDNRAGYRGGGISSRMHNHSCYLDNCIIWGNERGRKDGHQISAYSCHGSLHANNTVIQDEDNSDHICDPENRIKGHWLSMDPYFGRSGYWDLNHTPGYWYWDDDFWVEGDYPLKSQAGRWDPNSESWVQDDVTSPCIDAGNPNSPIGYEPFPNGGVINMGAYGGTREASKSYFGEPLCETILAGDINGDCKVDFIDLAILTRHWLGHLPPPPAADEDEDQDQTRPRR